MATNTTVGTLYKGDLAREIFVEAFNKSDSINKGAVDVIVNALGEGYLPKLTVDAALQSYACGWSPTGDIEYKDVKVILEKLMLQHEICNDDFDRTFQAAKSGLRKADNDIPADIQTAILDSIVKNVGSQVDSYIWNEPTKGLKAKLTADGKYIELQSVAITEANVVEEIGKVYNAIPSAIDGDPDLVIVTNHRIGKLYRQAQAKQGLNTTVGDKELDYLGLPILEIGGLRGSDDIFAYRLPNVAMLTGLENDINEVNIIDSNLYNGDGLTKTKVAFTLGVGFSFAEEVVWYGDFVV